MTPQPLSLPSVRRTVAAIAAGALIASLLSLSPAPARADTMSFDDPTGDATNGAPDIIRTTAGHASGGKLRHLIETDGTFHTADAPCVGIRAEWPGTNDYRVCGEGKMRNITKNETTADVTIARPDQRTIVYLITRKSIGGSSAYRWRAESRDPDCPLDRCDVAPDTYRLHEMTMTYEQWGLGFLKELDAKNCKANRILMLAWQANEGTAAVFNPLATTYRLPGSTNYNTTGVQNYTSLNQGVKALRLTLERGWSVYGYGSIVKNLRRCAPALKTAKAIRASSWCSGCSGGKYVMWLIDPVRSNYSTYANRLISTRPPRSPGSGELMAPDDPELPGLVHPPPPI